MRVFNNLYYMIILSFLLHITVFGISSYSLKRRHTIYIPTTYKVNIVSPVKRAKKRVAKKPATKKVTPKKTEAKKEVKKEAPAKPRTTRRRRITKDDIQLVEDRIKLMRSKKKVEEMAEMRSVIDISIKKLQEEQEQEKSEIEKEAAEVPPEGWTAEDQGALLANYYDIIYRHIKSAWTYTGDPDDFEAILLIYIDKNGNVKIIDIEQSSGSRRFDESVQRAILKASPLPPPPYEIGEVGLRFRP